MGRDERAEPVELFRLDVEEVEAMARAVANGNVSRRARAPDRRTCRRGAALRRGDRAGGDRSGVLRSTSFHGSSTVRCPPISPAPSTRTCWRASRSSARHARRRARGDDRPRFLSAPGCCERAKGGGLHGDLQRIIEAGPPAGRGRRCRDFVFEARPCSGGGVRIAAAVPPSEVRRAYRARAGGSLSGGRRGASGANRAPPYRGGRERQAMGFGKRRPARARATAMYEAAAHFAGDRECVEVPWIRGDSNASSTSRTRSRRC